MPHFSASSRLSALLCFSIFNVAVLRGQVVREKRGDTVLVSSSGGGVWKTQRTAVEELRLKAESGAYSFGEIRALAALSNGGVALFDASGSDGPKLVVLDGAGRVVRKLGRVGSGPGEYGRVVHVGALAEDAQGNLLMLDTGNNRINRWSADGRMLPAIIPRASIGERFVSALTPGPSGSLFVPARVIAYQPNQDNNALGFVHLDSLGNVLDTVRISPGMPFTQVRPMPSGAVAFLRGDHLAVNVMTTKQGRSQVTAMMHPREAIRYSDMERKEHDALNAFAAKQPGVGSGVPLPEYKLATRSLQVSGDGAVLWVRLPAMGVLVPEAEKLHPFADGPVISYLERGGLYGAFKADGTWMGQVLFSTPGFKDASFNKGVAWGAIQANDGVPVLIKWRIPQ